MTHTAGPWKISSKTAFGTKSYVEGAKGYVVAQCYHSPSSTITYNDLWEEAESNAKLAAAAPELLVALKDAIEFANAANHQIAGQDLPASAEWLAIIAKAEGRP